MPLRFLVSVTAALLAVSPAAGASDVDGDWDVVYQTDDGPRTAPLSVTTDGTTATATMGETQLTGTYEGGRLELAGEHYASDAGYTATVQLVATVEDGKLKGRWEWSEYSSTFEGTRPADQP